MAIKKSRFTLLRSFFQQYYSLLLLHVLPLTFLLIGSSLTLTLVYFFQEMAATLTYRLVFAVLSVFLMMIGFTPTSLVALVSAFWWGHSAFFTLIPCYMAAAWGSYVIAQRLPISQLLTRLLAEKTQKMQEKWVKNSALLVVSMRVSPVLPFVLTNLWLALIRVPFKDFFWGSLIGMLPRTVLLVWVGRQAPALLQAIESGKDTHSWVYQGGIVLFALSLFGMGTWAIQQWKYLKNK